MQAIGQVLFWTRVGSQLAATLALGNELYSAANRFQKGEGRNFLSQELILLKINAFPSSWGTAERGTLTELDIGVNPHEAALSINGTIEKNEKFKIQISPKGILGEVGKNLPIKKIEPCGIPLLKVELKLRVRLAGYLDGPYARISLGIEMTSNEGWLKQTIPLIGVEYGLLHGLDKGPAGALRLFDLHPIDLSN